MSQRYNKGILLLLLLAAFTYAQEQVIHDPNFNIVQSHYFDFPLTKKDYQHWKTSGTSFIHKNKVVLVPEARDKKGLFYSTLPNPLLEAWIVDIEVHLGNDQKTARGGTGLGFFYVKSVDKITHQDSIFGYTNRYEGLGVYLNTILRNEQNGQLVNPIQAYYNNGEQFINVFSSKEHICFRKLRNLPEEQYLKVRIFYDKPLVSVYYYSIYS